MTTVNEMNRLLLSRVRTFWRRYKKNRLAVVGLFIFLFFLFIAIFASIIAPFNPFKIGPDSLQPPSSKYLLGTDDLGRDILSGVLIGSRVSLTVGIFAAAISTIIGVAIGALSGYYGGVFDELVMRITEIFQVIPRFFLAIVVIALFGASIWNLIFVISITSWPLTTRLVRAEFLSLKEREFVIAAMTLGTSDLNIIFGEILPNAIAPIVVNASLQVASAIVIESGLGFLGLSDPNVISWGYMLNNAQRFLSLGIWWMIIPPGISILLVIFALNVMGDGLNDALNPRLKEK